MSRVFFVLAILAGIALSASVATAEPSPTGWIVVEYRHDLPHSLEYRDDVARERRYAPCPPRAKALCTHHDALTGEERTRASSPYRFAEAGKTRRCARGHRAVPYYIFESGRLRRHFMAHACVPLALMLAPPPVRR